MTNSQYINLCNQIRVWNEQYYVTNNPSISDAEYDQRLAELQNAEAEHPEWIIPDSPAQQVGGGHALCGLTSQQKMFTAEKVDEWWRQCGVDMLVAETKIDGCTLALDYVDGRLVKASLRDGGNGDNDVTDKARYIGGVPMVIGKSGRNQVRGEVYIPVDTFNSLNDVQVLMGKNEYANPRNLCAGTMQADDPALCKERGLMFLCWGFGDFDTVHTDYMSVMHELQDLGFDTVDGVGVDTSMSVERVISAMAKLRDSYSYPIDGLVFKVNDMRQWRRIGVTDHHPKYMTAYKFPAEQKGAVLRSVDWQVAASGKITPVANFDTVRLHKTNVNRATMNNAQWIRETLGDLCYGDELIISKGGEIIPKIIGVKHCGNGSPVELITRCPMCGAPLVHHLKQNGEYGKDLFCDNPECSCRTVARTKGNKIAVNQDAVKKPAPAVAECDIDINPKALENKSVVVSGTFSGKYTRQDIEAMIPRAGGKHVSSVSSKTSFIVAGEGMGPSKREKAERLGVRIITDKEFIEIIKC